MMKLQRVQKGFSVYSLSFYLLLIGVMVYTGLKLFPPYMTSFSVESSVRSLESDRGQTYNGVSAVKGSLFKKLRFNNVDTVTSDDIIVVRQDDFYVVDVDYEFRIPYFNNIELVISFTHHAEVPAS